MTEAPPLTAPRPGGRVGLTASAVAVAALALLAVLGLFIFPFATLTRDFTGSAQLLVHPGVLVNFASFAPTPAASLGGATTLGWVTFALALTLAASAFTRWRYTGWVAVALVASACVQLFVLVHAIDAVQLPLLAQGIPERRLPYQNYGPNLAWFIAVIAGVSGLVWSLMQAPARARALNRYRGLLVPMVALLLSIAVGGIVILALQPVQGMANGPASLARSFIGKADLLWFSYATLFGPALPRFRPLFDLAGPWQSLSQATPLIFTGLSLAFGFRSGLFNIGSPGQIVMGGIFAAAVGIYLPGPWPIVAPLTVAAAALGGGLWGALPGWLKARFGSNEVINTIMLNYVASGIMLFLLGKSTQTFFGRSFAMPFKAPGMEAKSLPLRDESHLASLIGLFGFHSGNNVLPLWPWLAVAFAIVAALAWRAPWRRRAGLVGAFAVAGALVGLIAGSFVLPISATMFSVRLNLSFLVALLAAVFYGVFMWRTKWGYELRAVGLAPRAAEYGGVNIRRNIILAMAISGALSGLAATHYVQGGAMEEYRLKQVIPSDIVGFAGITVALLGQNTPGGVLAAAALFGVMNTGGLNLTQSLPKVSRDIVTVLQALIVVFIATNGFLSGRFTKPAPASGE
ncbi:MAG TPA: ABC transporter permease, partial [Deinococcales bacterium]|nr:ABC transporter permease [Deinococcales bacterium]